jgi:phospho-N-acetylmuramoyl-pentapeptide-transferase
MLTKAELLLIIIGGVFVIEMLSVILQVASFKTRGKRIFKMSPLHHHYEMSGWSEWKIVSIFWLAGIVFAGIGLFMSGVLGS